MHFCCWQEKQRRRWCNAIERWCVYVSVCVSWDMTKEKRGHGSSMLMRVLRHVPVADGGHGDHRPPEPVRDRLEMAVRRPGLSEVDRWWEKHNTWKNERRRDRRTFRDACWVRRLGVVVVVVVREGQLVLALDLCHLYSHQHQLLHLQCVCGYFFLTNKRSLSANYGQFVDTKAHHSCRCWDPTYSPNIHGMTTTARFFVQTKKLRQLMALHGKDCGRLWQIW